jgi:predicted phage terminase large subunit-like protein
MTNFLSDWLRLEDESLTRQTLRQSLLAWANEVLSGTGQVPAPHHQYLITELDSLTRGQNDRLMILMPPGSAKSTYASILFPPWWFTQHPASSVIAVSHTHALAEAFSRRIRNLILDREGQLGYSLLPDERAAANWRTSSGGEYMAVGVRGGITGRRADLIIIDDPIKSQLEADSALHRDQLWEWYKSDLITRLKPHGRVILIMTRWHENDLGGQLLNASGAEWRVLRLPAIAEDNDLLGRQPGEALWPQWEDLPALERKRATMGERAWMALFQQTPRPAAGSLFKVGGLVVLDMPPDVADAKVVRAWDLAATLATGGNDPDWTVGVKMVRDARNCFTVLDVIRVRGTPRQTEDTIIATAHLDGPAVVIGLPEDPGQAGKAQISYLTGRLAGYRLLSSRETGAKLTRAMPLASQVEAGNVAIVRAGWNHALIEELRDFPLGRKDDQVDAMVRAFGTLARVPDPPRVVNLSFLTR